MPTFDDYVIKGVLVNNEFGIKSVHHLMSLNSIGLDREQYPSIINMIKRGDLDGVKNIPFGNKSFEYLEIMKFLDQNDNNYIVTVYSNDTLESDPQIIDLFFVN